MRELTCKELQAVSGGYGSFRNISKKTSVVKVVKGSISVKQVVVQRNGVTLVDTTTTTTSP